MSDNTTPAAEESDLGPLLRPDSVAIIGASRTREIISGRPQRILAQHGYSGTVYPVNPRYDEIDERRCYPSVGEVPGPVDVALIVVNADLVPTVLAACGKAGVRFAVVISSGFAEQVDATARQSQLESVRAEYPALRIIGPNAEGLINVVDDIPLGFSPTVDYDRGLHRLRRGDVAIVAQSGGLGFALFNDGLARGLGFSHVISTGNEVDLDLADVADYLVADPATRVLLLFLEGIRSPRRLADLAAAARSRGTTVIVAKVGASPEGKRAALAHTAHDAGEESRYSALLDDSGVLRVGDQEEMVDMAMAFSRTRRPEGSRVGIVTTSGGAGTWVTDDVIAAGLDVPTLSAGVQTRLRELIPAYGNPANPVDATAQVLGRGGIVPAIDIVARSGEVDAVVLTLTLADAMQLEREREPLAAVASRIPVVIYSYTRPAQRSVDVLEELGIAYYTSGRRTAAALKALTR